MDHTDADRYFLKHKYLLVCSVYDLKMGLVKRLHTVLCLIEAPGKSFHIITCGLTCLKCFHKISWIRSGITFSPCD